MKRILTLLALLITLISKAQIQPFGYKDNSFSGQVNIGGGTFKATHAGAYLEVGIDNSIRGVLMPRGDTSLVASPTKGLILYQKVDSQFYYHNGLRWMPFCVKYTDEMAQDATAALIDNGTGLTWTYNDAANSLVGNVSLAPFTTSDLAEGTRLYYTDNRVWTAFTPGTGITIDTLTGLISAASSGGVRWVGMTVPTGFTITGSPITDSGTLALGTNLNGIVWGNGSGFNVVNVGAGLDFTGGTLTATGTYTDEMAMDIIGDSLVRDTTGVRWLYQDNLDKLFAVIRLTDFTTDSLPVGTVNKYFTNALARSAFTFTAPLSFNTTTGVVTIDLSGYVPVTRTINTIHSITGGGNLTTDRTFSLVNDMTSPGGRKYYGTDSTGSKGWFLLPNGGEGGEGGITSVGLSGPVGIGISGSPITSGAGTLDFSINVNGILQAQDDTLGVVTVGYGLLYNRPLLEADTAELATIFRVNYLIDSSATIHLTTADNGLNMSNQTNVQLGGPLVENTTITTTGYDFNLVDLPNTTTGNIIYYNNSTGQLTYGAVPVGTVTSVNASISGALGVTGGPITSSGTLAFAWQGTSAQYVQGDGTLATFPTLEVPLTFDNGLTRTANNIRLGGPLLETTTITATGHSLIVTSTSTTPLNVNTTSGIAISAAGGTQGIYTSGSNMPLWLSNNSATAAGTHVGILMQRTSVTGITGTGLSIRTDLNNSAAGPVDASQVVTSWTNATAGNETAKYEILLTNGGVLSTTKLSLAGNGQLSLPDYGDGTFTGTATNWLGVTSAGDVIEIAPPSYESPLTFDNGLTRSTNNVQLGGALLHNTALTANFNFSVNDGTVSIGASAVAASSKLYVQQTTGGSAGYFLRTGAASGTTPTFGSWGYRLINSGSSYSTAQIISGYYGQLEIATGSAYSITSNKRINFSGTTGVVSMVNATGNITATNTMLSGGAFYLLAAGSANVDKFAAIRAMYPIQNQSNDAYSGTISNYYGLYIDPINTDLPSAVTNRFAIYQEGTTDLNMFKGPIQADGLPATTGAYNVVVRNDATGRLELVNASLGGGEVPLTFDNGLTRTANNVQLGGTLVQNTTIDATGIYQLIVSGSISSGSGVFAASNSGTGNAIRASSVSSAAIFATTTNSSGVQGTSTNGSGISGTSTAGTGGSFSSTNGFGVSGVSSATAAGVFLSALSSTNSVDNVVIIRRETTGTAANGIGAAISYESEAADGSRYITNTLVSKLTDATALTRTSQFIITGVNSGTTGDILTLNGNKSIKANGYGAGTFTGTVTYNLAVDADGDVIEVAASGGITADEGITANTSTNVQLGSPNNSGVPLTATRFINTGTNTLRVRGSSSLYPFYAENTGSGFGAYIESATGVAAQMITNPSSTNTSVPVLNIVRGSSGTAANGIGAQIDFYVKNDGGSSTYSNSLVSKWTDVVNASRTSQFIITGVNSAVTADLLTLSGNGALKLNKYGANSFTGTAAYNLAVDASGNVIEVAAGGGGSITANNGLTMSTSTNVQLGGTLLQNTSIVGNFTLGITNANNSTASFSVNNTGTTSTGIDGTGTLYGTVGTSATGIGVLGRATSSGTGGYFVSTGTGGLGSITEVVAATTNTIEPITVVRRGSSGTATNGIGAAINFEVKESNTTTAVANQIVSKWTNATYASRTSQFIITGVNSATTADLFTLSGSGALKLNKYGVNTFAGTAAYALGVDASGNVIEFAAGGGGSYTDEQAQDATGAMAASSSKVSLTYVDATPSLTADIVAGSLVNADISTSAAIAYSKLNLTGAILNADLAGSIAISKLSITGTPDGTKYLRDDGSWQTVSGGGSPGGSNRQIQFNNSGAFGGAANFTYNSAGELLIGTATDNGAFSIQSGGPMEIEGDFQLSGNDAVYQDFKAGATLSTSGTSSITLAAGTNTGSSSAGVAFLAYAAGNWTSVFEYYNGVDLKMNWLKGGVGEVYMGGTTDEGDYRLQVKGNVHITQSMVVAQDIVTAGNYTTIGGSFTTQERTAPSTPATNYVVVYAKSDGLLYGKDDAGVETKLSNDAGGGAGDMILASTQTNTGAKTFNSGTLIFAGSTSGTTILNANAVAGSGTVVLPTTGTLATLAGSETFTNKDLTSGTNTFPTFNQSTTGSAATLTTTRTIWGQNFNGSANVTGTLTLGANDLTMTGSLAATGARVTKGWFTDGEFTNMITINGTSLSSVTATLANKSIALGSNTVTGTIAQFNTALTDGDFATQAGTETFTNKRITARAGTTTSSATPTINTDNVDYYSLTAQAVDITSFTTNLTGTPTIGQTLWIMITGTASRAITWGASFENGAAVLPTTTSGTTRLDVKFIWNEATSKWRCMAAG